MRRQPDDAPIAKRNSPKDGTYKKDREDTLHRLAMKNYLEEKAAAQRKHKEEQALASIANIN